MFAVYQPASNITGVPARPAWHVRVQTVICHWLERGLHTHPILTCAAALAAAGCGMVAAVAAITLAAALPLCALTALV